MKKFLVFILFVALHLHADPLPSWNEGKIKTAILEFVKETTREGGASYVPPDERIATFDQDGTLWVEQPIPAQLAFIFDRIKKLAPEHPEWAHEEPFNKILHDDVAAIQHFGAVEIKKIVIATQAGMSVEDFLQDVQVWFKTAMHPRYKRPYSALVYQPMREVIALLKENGYKCYIVSGNSQEFIRAYALEVYGIPTERIIGTMGKVKYEYREGHPILLKTPEFMLIDVKEGKPEGIHLLIGQKPVAAFGNSIGDEQMLEWTQSGKGKRFELLVHHDDPVREYAYGPEVKIGTFSDALMEKALKNNWHVVSMKNDWKIIFSWENKP